MIYGFVKQSEGQVRIDSTVGRGASVTVYLPRCHGTAAVEATSCEVQSQPPRPLAGGTVLIVDDEPAVRRLVTELLKDLGYATIEADDSIAAAKLLRSDIELDLLITDFGLPGGLNGRELAALGRQRREHLKVLIITGYVENTEPGPQDWPRGVQLLAKPFTIDALTDCIRNLEEIDLSGPGPASL